MSSTPLDHVRETYEQLGRDDPLWAVLGRKGTRHNRWEPAEFFRTGEREIEAVFVYLGELGVSVERDRALDFGCGVGRLTQPLADHFDRVVGVDISHTMLDRARHFNRHRDRVSFVLNTSDDLSRFEDASFDFVYTNIVLQHVPPEPAQAYVREFFRVLRPGGTAVFQIPNGPPIEPGSFRSWLYTLRRRHFRRLWKRLRGRAPYEMHFVARERVVRIVEEAGARLVDVVDVDPRGRGRNLRYCAVNGPEPE